MFIDLKCSLSQSYFTLPIQFQVNSLIIWIFIGDYCLLVATFYFITISEIPEPFPVGLVVFELPLVVGIVREDPFTLHYLVILPCAQQFLFCCEVLVRPLPILFIEHPLPWVSIFILIIIGALTMLHPIFPLTYINYISYHSTRPYLYMLVCQSHASYYF